MGSRASGRLRDPKWRAHSFNIHSGHEGSYTKSRLYSGTAAIASTTDEPVSRVRDAFRLAIYGEG